MGFSLYHPTLLTCKRFFNLFKNITNNTAIVCNSYGIHVKCSNKRFQIHSILDEISFKDYSCSQEYILGVSIKQLNYICNQYNEDASIRILYSEQPNILIIINNNCTHSIPCHNINNPEYISRIHTLDDIDYQVEFEIQAKYLYTLLKQTHKTTSKNTPQTITIRSDVHDQGIYLDNVCISGHKKIDLYPFVKNLNKTYAFSYIAYGLYLRKLKSEVEAIRF